MRKASISICSRENGLRRPNSFNLLNRTILFKLILNASAASRATASLYCPTADDYRTHFCKSVHNQPHIPICRKCLCDIQEVRVPTNDNRAMHHTAAIATVVHNISISTIYCKNVLCLFYSFTCASVHLF